MVNWIHSPYIMLSTTFQIQIHQLQISPAVDISLCCNVFFVPSTRNKSFKYAATCTRVKLFIYTWKEFNPEEQLNTYHVSLTALAVGLRFKTCQLIAGWLHLNTRTHKVPLALECGSLDTWCKKYLTHIQQCLLPRPESTRLSSSTVRGLAWTHTTLYNDSAVSLTFNRDQ